MSSPRRRGQKIEITKELRRCHPRESGDPKGISNRKFIQMSFPHRRDGNDKVHISAFVGMPRCGFLPLYAGRE
jgi:hypothetical protein